MTVLAAAVFALVMGAVWYVAVPWMYGAPAPQQQQAPDAQGLLDGAAELIGGAAEGVGGAVSGLGEAAGGIEEAVGGLDGVAGGLGETADYIGGVAGDIGSAVSGVLPGAEPAGPAGGPERGGAEAAGAEAPDPGEYYVANRTGFKETLTHRYVAYPPCAAVLDDAGREVRTIFGITTPIPQDSGARLGPLKVLDPNHLASEGFEPKPCALDRNGNGLGDGWEDGNGDGYADGFTDCTKPYAYEDGWYVRELGRDCKYGAPAQRAGGGTGGGGGSSGGGGGDGDGQPAAGAPGPPRQSGGYYDDYDDGGGPSGENVVPYATAQTGTMTRVIDGDTIVVDGDVRIRLALVNAPERGEDGYEEAASFTRSKCPAGTTVVYDVDDGQRSGSYGRMIALVWCVGYGSTGTQAASPLNALLVDGGYAEIDRRFCTASEFGDDEWALRGGC